MLRLFFIRVVDAISNSIGAYMHNALCISVYMQKCALLGAYFLVKNAYM